MTLTIADSGQPANPPDAAPPSIFRVVPTVVPTPLPAPIMTDTIRLSEAAEIHFLHSQGQDQTQINVRLGIFGSQPEAE